MRVLHMIPDISVSNGVMSVILNYAKAMPSEIKFDVVYFAEKEKTRQADIEALGGKVYKVNPPSPKDLLTGKMNGFFSKHMNEWDALHIHCPHFAVFIAPYAKRAGIKNIFVHCHTTEFSLQGNGRRNQLLSLYAKYFIKDKFACSNEAGRLWYGNKAFKIINNAVDCDKFIYDDAVRHDVRKQMDLENSFVVGHIGKTDIPQKNHPFIFKVFAEIKKKNSNSKLVLIGAEETVQTSELCKTLNIKDSVMYLGMRDDINQLLQACDVFLFPSISEGLPVSVIEAQAAGLSVVMSDAVTKEVCVTDLVKIKSLADNEEEWCKACLDASETARRDTSEILSQKGWNIYQNAEILVDFYSRS
ncbi:MAG: glycosyltransferase [Acetobacter sp.]|nr:glycosyltransferase [Bacteroides sp.]MCM1341569.1 glycosyltransferase [Acetobacter sp.]MCM1433646.1 glycosyltransferase [Clostridiales bacterium]